MSGREIELAGAMICVIAVIGLFAIVAMVAGARRQGVGHMEFVTARAPTPPVPGVCVTSTWEGVVVYDRDEVGKVTVAITDGTFFDAVVPSRGAWIAMQAGQRVRGVRDEKGEYIVTGFVK